jgi:hypothetical protein
MCQAETKEEDEEAFFEEEQVMRLPATRVLTAPVVLLSCLMFVSSAWGGSPPAVGAAAGFTIESYAAPTIFSTAYNALEPSPYFHGLGNDESPTVSNSYTLTVRNAGSVATEEENPVTKAKTPIVISDTLPAGVTATRVEAREFQSIVIGGGENLQELEGQPELPCSKVTVSCVYEGSLRPGDMLRMRVYVDVAGGVGSSVVNAASVSGGGAPAVSTVASNRVGSAEESLAVPFGFENFNAQATSANGLTDAQAGDHPYETTVSFMANTAYLHTGQGGLSSSHLYPQNGVRPGYQGTIKDFVLDLPPGVVGDPQTTPKCPQVDVGGASIECPPDTQVGVITNYFDPRGLTGASINEHTAGKTLFEVATTPIYNIEPEKGYPAQFEFTADEEIVTLHASVTEETNYGARVTVSDIPQASGVIGSTVTFFGSPTSDPNMDDLRFGQGEDVAFLDNPTGCSNEPQVAKVSMDTWEQPGVLLPDGAPDLSDSRWASATTTMYPQVTGCEVLQFDPAIEVLPDTSQADEPSGLTINLRVPQAAQQAPSLVTPELKNATVTLPAGLSISPAAAEGLQGCSDAQIDFASPTAGACPQASELGTVKIATPLLTEPLEGHVFLGSPGCDPCSSADAADGNELRIFLEAAGSGVVIKKLGTIYANPSTGQLTSTFLDNPQVPFTDLELHFKSGLRAPLAMPQTCGTFTTTSDLTPWSTPVTPDADSVSPFSVDWDGHGGACPAVLPFGPYFSAGTSNPNAGQFSPLTITFGREDREQDLSGIQVRTPPGLLGTLTGVPLCGEPQASLGTCSQASKIGSMTVAAGPGGHPFYEKGSLYLTGPYKGAPFGLSIVVPTVAGPFNLGNVVVRARIDVDPDTTALTVTSDAFPQIIDGIPLRLRTANVTVDRPGFIFNPTNCAQQQIQATVTGAQGAVSNVSAPFAVSGCKGLAFAPKFSVYTQGHTSRVDGASLDVKLAYPTGPQSNISHVRVELPKQLPARLTTLQKACPAATFQANPASCPRASLVGVAKAITPVLPTPLVGPAYFVSHGGEAFPNLIVVLQGYGVRVDLIGDTFINKEGITSSTFTNVPDVQVSSFELYLPEGPFSALAANGNLCKQKLMLPSSFIAQDGAQVKENTPVQVTGCAKTKKKAKASRVRRARTATSHRADRRSER